MHCKKETLKIFLILFFPLITYSQNFQIKYEYKVPSGSILKYTLKTNGEYSEFTNNNTDGGNLVSSFHKTSSRKFFVLKDIDQNLLLSTDFLGNRRFVIKDSLNIMEWELINSSPKSILGFDCKKAQTSFRGRDYVAYYTPEIKTQDGPWKFQGLPGLIMEIQSKDGEYQYRAFEVCKVSDFSNKTNLVEGKTYTWQEFKNLFITYTDNLINYMDSNKGETGYSDYYLINKPEIIYERAQTGNGIEF